MCDLTRCMWPHRGSPVSFDRFALSTAVYLKNRNIHSAHKKTLFGTFHISNSDASYLHFLGCKSLVLNQDRNNLDNNAREPTLLENADNSKASMLVSTDGTEIKVPKIGLSWNITLTDIKFSHQCGLQSF